MPGKENWHHSFLEDGFLEENKKNKQDIGISVNCASDVKCHMSGQQQLGLWK